LISQSDFKTVFIFLLMPCVVLASDWRDAYVNFSTTPNRTKTLSISWMVVPNSKVQATCEAISNDSGLGGFGVSLGACSFWHTNTCVIVTGEQTTHSTLGHEIRHCYQGNFH
jgi:hypothetical protein